MNKRIYNEYNFLGLDDKISIIEMYITHILFFPRDSKLCWKWMNRKSIDYKSNNGKYHRVNLQYQSYATIDFSWMTTTLVPHFKLSLEILWINRIWYIVIQNGFNVPCWISMSVETWRQRIFPYIIKLDGCWLYVFGWNMVDSITFPLLGVWKGKNEDIIHISHHGNFSVSLHMTKILFTYRVFMEKVEK